MGLDIIKVFNFSASSNWGFWKLKTMSFFTSARSGAVTSPRFGVNFPRQCTIPKNLWSSVSIAKQTFCYCVSFGKINFNTLWRDYISQKYNRIFAKDSEAIAMLCKGFSLYYYVILGICTTLNFRNHWQNSFLKNFISGVYIIR